MTQSPLTPKKAVALIEAAFKARNSDIVTKDAYHLLAQVWGYKDWPTASAALAAAKPAKKKKPTGPTCLLSKDMADWPVWVFCNQGGAEDEPLYAYPFGTRLDDLIANRHHWHLIDDSETFCVELPMDVMSPADAQKVAGEEVACAYPDGEEYGVPACATDHGVEGFLKEELGFSYVGNESGTSYVDVTSRCRGDDGNTEWWVQARVHPEVHARLIAWLSPALCAFEADYASLSLQDLIRPTEPAKAWEPARAHLADVCGTWFTDYGTWRMGEVLDKLKERHPGANVYHSLPAGYRLRSRHGNATVGELGKALQDALRQARELLRGR